MNPAASTKPKALRQLDLSIEATEQAEAEALDQQHELGEALRDLRIACMVPRNAIAAKMAVDCMILAAIERRADSVTAKKYRAAVVFLSAQTFGR